MDNQIRILLVAALIMGSLLFGTYMMKAKIRLVMARLGMDPSSPEPRKKSDPLTAKQYLKISFVLVLFSIALVVASKLVWDSGFTVGAISISAIAGYVCIASYMKQVHPLVEAGATRLEAVVLSAYILITFAPVTLVVMYQIGRRNGAL